MKLAPVSWWPVALLLMVSACDDDKGDDGKTAQAKTEDESDNKEKEKAKSDEKEKSGDEVAEPENAHADAGAKAEAEAEAGQEGGEQEPAKEPGPVDGLAQATELALSEVRLAANGSSFAKSQLTVKAKATWAEDLPKGVQVHAKAACRHDGKVFVDTSPMRPGDFKKNFKDFAKGDSTDIEVSLFRDGVGEEFKNCEVHFRLGSGDGFTKALGQAHCWERSGIKEGACDPPMKGDPPAGTDNVAKLDKLEAKSEVKFEKPELTMTTMVHFAKTPKGAARLGFKGVCDVDTLRLASFDTRDMRASVFPPLPGEIIIRKPSLFRHYNTALTQPVQKCDFIVQLRESKRFDEPDIVTEIGHVCFDDGSVRDGPCDPSKVTSVPGEKLAADSISLPRLEITVKEDKEKFYVDMWGDAVVARAVQKGVRLRGSIDCKVGKQSHTEENVSFQNPELETLQPGEAARIHSTVFRFKDGLDKPPKKCELKVHAASWTDSKNKPELGTFCFKKDSTTAGTCDGSGDGEPTEAAASDAGTAETPAAEAGGGETPTASPGKKKGRKKKGRKKKGRKKKGRKKN